MAEPASRLARLTEALERGQPPGPEEAAWLASGLRRYLDRAAEGARLDRELGLVGRPGETPWWERERVERRNAAIRELMASRSGSVTAKAAAAQAELRNYATCCWPRDRERGAPYPDTPRRRLLFRLFTLDPAPPLGLRQLYGVLAGSDCSDSSLLAADPSGDPQAETLNRRGPDECSHPLPGRPA